MSQTLYYVPVPFAHFQDPSTSSDAPASGSATQAPGASTQAADGAGTGPSSNAPGACTNDPVVMMMPLFLVAMYFFMIRPEQKRKREQQTLLASIKQGDHVVTISGMHGEVSSLTEKTVTLRVDSIHMTFDRSAVARIEREPSTDGVAAAN